MKGQSIIEVIVAVSILVIIAASSVVAILGAFSSGRLAEEETRASLIASEGLEAVQSIRNQSWSDLIDGLYGLENLDGAWVFSGNEDTDPTGKFTRTVELLPVRRDLTGDITQSGGIVDEDTKEVIINVNWAFTPGRINDVRIRTYLTNWQEAVDPNTAIGGTITTCNDFCQGTGYVSGLCRKSQNECSSNSETYEEGGDQFCINKPNDTCCCSN